MLDLTVVGSVHRQANHNLHFVKVNGNVIVVQLVSDFPVNGFSHRLTAPSHCLSLQAKWIEIGLFAKHTDIAVVVVSSVFILSYRFSCKNAVCVVIGERSSLIFFHSKKLVLYEW